MTTTHVNPINKNMEWMKNNLDRTFLLRFALMIIMIMHGVTSFMDMSVIDFGRFMEGWFGFMGVPMAILVKLIHVVTIPALLFKKYLKPLAALNIVIFPDGNYFASLETRLVCGRWWQ
jgi:putative oxidoreductase